MKRNIEEIQAKALEAMQVINELEELARENNFGLQIDYGGDMNFEDWESSDCYGEGNSENFSVSRDGNFWIPSTC